MRAPVTRDETTGKGWRRRFRGVSSLTATGGRLFAGADYPGVFRCTPRGATWTLFTTLDDQARRSRTRASRV